MTTTSAMLIFAGVVTGCVCVVGYLLKGAVDVGEARAQAEADHLADMVEIIRSRDR